MNMKQFMVQRMNFQNPLEKKYKNRKEIKAGDY